MKEFKDMEGLKQSLNHNDVVSPKLKNRFAVSFNTKTGENLSAFANQVKSVSDINVLFLAESSKNGSFKLEINDDEENSALAGIIALSKDLFDMNVFIFNAKDEVIETRTFVNCLFQKMKFSDLDYVGSVLPDLCNATHILEIQFADLNIRLH